MSDNVEVNDQPIAEPAAPEMAGFPENTQCAGDEPVVDPGVEVIKQPPTLTPEQLKELKQLVAGDVPGAAPMTAADQHMIQELNSFIPQDLVSKENLTPEEQQRVQDGVNQYIRHSYLVRYDLDKIDIDAEYQKIQDLQKALAELGPNVTRKERDTIIREKGSSLSRSRRDALVAYKMIFEIAPRIQAKIKDLQEKENKTKEEEELLQHLTSSNDLPQMIKDLEKMPANIQTAPEAPGAKSAPVEN